jgi:hypothetical protein
MKRTNKTLIAALVLTAAGVAQAQISGDLYENTQSSPWTHTSPDTGAEANEAVPGTALPGATFTVPNGFLGFNSADGSTPYTIGTWLVSGGATGITYANGGASGDTMNNTILTLSGEVTVTHNESFTASQDDGLELYINGVNVIANPGPNSITSESFTWTGLTGNYPFSLEYSEIDGPPATLVVDLPFTPSTAPDMPGTLSLLGLGLSGLAAFGRRFRK